MGTTAPEQPLFHWMIVTSPVALGKAVRAMRVAKGLSKLEAARRCRVGPRFLLEVENGKPTVRLDSRS